MQEIIAKFKNTESSYEATTPDGKSNLDKIPLRKLMDSPIMVTHEQTISSDATLGQHAYDLYGKLVSGGGDPSTDSSQSTLFKFVMAVASGYAVLWLWRFMGHKV
jgi:hypothetical protein